MNEFKPKMQLSELVQTEFCWFSILTDDHQCTCHLVLNESVAMERPSPDLWQDLCLHTNTFLAVGVCLPKQAEMHRQTNLKETSLSHTMTRALMRTPILASPLTYMDRPPVVIQCSLSYTSTKAAETVGVAAKQ